MSSPMAASAPSGSSSVISTRSAVSAGAAAALVPNFASSAQFREIHKSTWLKRLTAEGKRITVGPKKSERSWVVFCVHDDKEALLEGYAEPRQAANHNPEWIVSMQDTLHISHALIPNSHEFEFVVTFSNEVVRFHAMSWEIMQEWVMSLRSKLREMKILSPRENLYTKLPEIRAPLLPTRDPTSPLPAPPPVPAALVPGVERVVPQSAVQDNASISETIEPTTRVSTSANATIEEIPTSSAATSTSTTTSTTPILTSMSNTLTQNLLNMLSNPFSAYSEHFNEPSTIEDQNTVLNESSETILTENEANLFDFSDADFFTPLLRNSSTLSNVPLMSNLTGAPNSVRFDINSGKRTSADQIKNLDILMQCERLPRPQTSRSLSAGAADKSRKDTVKAASHHKETHVELTTCSNNNITELEISTENTHTTTCNKTTISPEVDDGQTNITIIQVSTNISTENESDPPKLPVKSTTAEVFKFPETHTAAAATTNKTKQLEYKSNVQIIPSNTNSSTIQVLGQGNQYSTPVKKTLPNTTAATAVATIPPSAAVLENNQITTVHVAGDDNPNAISTNAISVYGTCFTSATSSAVSSPQLPQKIILPANTCGITNISVNNSPNPQFEPLRKSTENSNCENLNQAHYEKVFLTSSSSTQLSSAPGGNAPPVSPNLAAQWNSPRHQRHISKSVQSTANVVAEITDALQTTSPSPTPSTTATNAKHHQPSSSEEQQTPAKTSANRNKCLSAAAQIAGRSPLLQRKAIVSPTNTRPAIDTSQPPLPTRPPFLTRGLTEAVITTRPSRKDFHFLKLSNAKAKLPSVNAANRNINVNNNGDLPSTSSSGNTPQHLPINNRINTESMEQRRRSSSTSDAQAHRNNRTTNNNEFLSNRLLGSSANSSSAIRMQQPPQPFRNAENGCVVGGGGDNNRGVLGLGSGASPITTTTSPAAKRMTLREQQVMQLRREIMHPGGVRLQLRRKDCIGSIAWVDAFGAVWVAGWKQKEHPVLYNALHIGDQLLSIAGVTIATAVEANKIIRNTNTLFVEVLVRRIPFGRALAIRRDREGQCLGLIRDGNTSTIVDVVPNSLAARHGLPPKAQSCDGSTLTFWVLTEINGRPLNLFFKEHEIRDRLNSVGRDISILVQPSDLITKLKKQLKSLRGYKDYLVQ